MMTDLGKYSILPFAFVFLFFSTTNICAQGLRREISPGKGGLVEVVNRYGRVEVTAVPEKEKIEVIATAATPIAESELVIDGSRIETKPSQKNNRIDISITVPERIDLRIETGDGEVRVTGRLGNIQIKTDTGTIATNVPTDDIRYELLWTESKPRFLSDFELEKVREGAAGRFSIKGKFSAPHTEKSNPSNDDQDEKTSTDENVSDLRSKKSDSKDAASNAINLKFTTARGIVLLNVPPNEVMSDLRERPLTNAAKAVIKSGDTLLTDAIRRASPKYFGEYARTLPPLRREPGLSVRQGVPESQGSTVKTASVRVTDLQNRAVPGLLKDDFEVTESSVEREVLAVRPSTAPVNLVLLLDVSGSIENYVNFIRKAARAFVETVDRNDRVSIVIFNEDVKTLAGFTTDKEKLSESLDTFDAGGGTAYYDALGFTLTETLRPLRGERTAIVVLTDGDDNRSFLPFDSLTGSIEESGALIYPLYVPTSLIARASTDSDTAVDPLRSRYLSNDITSKAAGEGKRLAAISGGVYYPITQLSQIQQAYDDIVLQLRTAYDVTFRSEISTQDGKPSPRLKIRSKKPNTFVQIRSITIQN